jgi:lysozyme family protein
MSIDKIINDVIAREGSAYTNDPKDSGGPTKYGITHTTLARYRGAKSVTPEQVENLTRAEAFNVYNWLYASKPGFDKIVALSPAIGAEVIDTGVNCGVGVAGTILQRCLNAFNLGGTKYRDILVDGDCGPATITALKAFLDWRGNEGALVLLRALNSLQGERYIDIAERRPKDEAFAYGWFRERVSMPA